jgi:hypothetical protein
LLEHRPARGDRLEALISIARCPVGNQRRHQTQWIEPHRAGRRERPDDIRQLLLEHGAATRMQIMGHAELRHAFARPPLPRLVDRPRRPFPIALQHRDLVTIPAHEHPRREPAYPRTQHNDPRHRSHPRTLKPCPVSANGTAALQEPQERVAIRQSGRQEVDQQPVHVLGRLQLHPMPGSFEPLISPKTSDVLCRVGHLPLGERAVSRAPHPHRRDLDRW